MCMHMRMLSPPKLFCSSAYACMAVSLHGSLGMNNVIEIEAPEVPQSLYTASTAMVLMISQ